VVRVVGSIIGQGRCAEDWTAVTPAQSNEFSILQPFIPRWNIGPESYRGVHVAYRTFNEHTAGLTFAGNRFLPRIQFERNFYTNGMFIERAPGLPGYPRASSSDTEPILLLPTTCRACHYRIDHADPPCMHAESRIAWSCTSQLTSPTAG
jgi:hypothetical protein